MNPPLNVFFVGTVGFARAADGWVDIWRHLEDPQGTTYAVIDTINPNEWASIVASVSAQGENADTFWAALHLHEGAQ